MKFALWLLSLTVAASSCSAGNPHRQPSPPSVLIDSYQLLEDGRYQAALAYASERVRIKGFAVFDTSKDRLAIRGEYRAYQALQNGARLSFQTYDSDMRLLNRENPRSEFQKEDDHFIAKLDLELDLGDLGLRPRDRYLQWQFNYVQEEKFWYDTRFPELELPSIAFSEIPRAEAFEPIVGFLPKIAPKSVPTAGPFLFRAFHPSGGAFKHRNALDAKFGSNFAAIHFPRRDIANALSLRDDRFASYASFSAKEAGKLELRQGFVWDGVQWYDLYQNSKYKTIHVVSNPVYVSLVGAAALLVFACLGFCQRISNAFLRRSVRTLCALAGLFVLAHMATTAYFLIFAILALLAILSRSGMRFPSKLYIFALLTLFSIEYFWIAVFAVAQVSYSQLAMSGCLYAILLSPLVLIRRRSWGIVALSAIMLLSAGYFTLISHYAHFFDDLPSARMAIHAGQIANIMDSILELLDDRHATPLVFWAWSWLWLLLPRTREASS